MINCFSFGIEETSSDLLGCKHVASASKQYFFPPVKSLKQSQTGGSEDAAKRSNHLQDAYLKKNINKDESGSNSGL